MKGESVQIECGSASNAAELVTELLLSKTIHQISLVNTDDMGWLVGYHRQVKVPPNTVGDQSA